MSRRRRLIERREELGLTQEKVAAAIGANVRMVRAYEDGSATPRQTRRLRLATVMDWSGAQLTVALNGDDPVAVGHAMPGWLGRLGEIEQASGFLAAWEPVAVHGLLQTEAYALAVEAADAVTKSDDAIARRVESRLGRQRALGRDDPLVLHVIIDESVLHRVAGNRATMAGQLDHLADVAAWPNVTIQVLPFGAGRFSAAFGAFSLFSQPGMPAPWLAVTEDRAGPHYHDADHHPQAVQAHVDVFDHLASHSLDPDSTIDLIRRMAKEYR